MPVASLQDMTRCIACKACQVACKEWNELPAVATHNGGGYENPGDLGPTTWTRVQFVEVEEGGEPRWLFFKQQCMHCRDAACVRVCPTGALKNHPRGFVSFERDLCNGCGYCEKFCPFGAVRIAVASIWTGAAKASKCTLCQDRIMNGAAPACAKACPTGAIRFGDRDELVAAGRERVAELRAHGRAGANLYGETELGGLGVLYVLPEPPSRYPRALPQNPEGAWLAASFWQKLLHPAGVAGLALAIAALAANYVAVARRDRRRAEAGADKDAP